MKTFVELMEKINSYKFEYKGAPLIIDLWSEDIEKLKETEIDRLVPLTGFQIRSGDEVLYKMMDTDTKTVRKIITKISQDSKNISVNGESLDKLMEDNGVEIVPSFSFCNDNPEQIFKNKWKLYDSVENFIINFESNEELLEKLEKMKINYSISGVQEALIQDVIETISKIFKDIYVRYKDSSDYYKFKDVTNIAYRKIDDKTVYSINMKFENKDGKQISITPKLKGSIFNADLITRYKFPKDITLSTMGYSGQKEFNDLNKFIKSVFDLF